LFFPWSKLCRGYFLKTLHQERQLKKLLKYEYISSFPLLVVILLVDHIALDLFFIGMLIFYYTAVKLILRDEKERE
jgi:hypothetical protein